MRKLRYQRRQSRSAIWSFRLAVVALLLLLGAVLGHRFWSLEIPKLFVAACVSGVLALLALICAGEGFLNLWNNGDKGGGRSFWGAFFALCVLLPIGTFAAFWYQSLPYYDLSTDFDGQMAFPQPMPLRSEGMNSLENTVRPDPVTQISAYPDVIGRSFDASPDRVALAVKNTLSSFHWPVVAQGVSTAGGNGLLIATTAHDFWLGFASDMLVRLLDEGDSTYVDVRSVSQYGSRDMGMNASFITQFMTALDAEVNKAPADVEQ